MKNYWQMRKGVWRRGALLHGKAHHRLSTAQQTAIETIYIYSHSTSIEQHIIFIACDNLNKKWWFFWRRTGRVYWEGFCERGEKCYNLISQFKGESWGVVWGEGGYMLLDVMRKIYHGIKREHWSRNIDCGIFFLPSTGLNIKDDTHLFTMKIAIKFINLKLSFYFNH